LNQDFALGEAIAEALILARSTARAFPPVQEILEAPDQVHADRSLVVQIMLNLLTNARDAIQELNPPSPQIRLTLRAAESGLLALSITDNGIGIAPDRLVAIFSYGQTSKPTGHGFGLHNAANAARAQGGRLVAHSPGENQGATFTLYLPIARPAHHLDHHAN
jgi:signal transduction histidine kinase